MFADSVLAETAAKKVHADLVVAKSDDQADDQRIAELTSQLEAEKKNKQALETEVATLKKVPARCCRTHIDR